MAHPNEDHLRDLYAIFAKGDLQGFLDGCTDDVTFHVPGDTRASGELLRAPLHLTQDRECPRFNLLSLHFKPQLPTAISGPAGFATTGRI